MDTMWDDVGVLRTSEGLHRGLEKLGSLKSELFETGLVDDNRVFNLSWHDWLNLQSLIDVSEIIASAALSRENSRGAHYREDFTDTGSLEASYFTLARRLPDKIEVQQAPVEFSLIKPGESLLDDYVPAASNHGGDL